MGWKTNPIMEWSEDEGATWVKISDHGRSPLSVSVERIEDARRMADGYMRRYTVAKKKTWTCTWENMPDKAGTFLANGQAGRWMEDFFNRVNKSFLIRLRTGSDVDTNITGQNGEVYRVMVTSFSKEITKRGKAFDLWSLDMSLEEC